MRRTNDKVRDGSVGVIDKAYSDQVDLRFFVCPHIKFGAKTSWLKKVKIDV